jgi:hypothetical protein
MALHKLRNAVINALTVVGRLMGIIAIVAAPSPTSEEWIEDVFVHIFYGASVHGAHKHA